MLPNYLKVSEAVVAFGISRYYLRYAEKQGWLVPLRSPGGVKRYRLGELDLVQDKLFTKKRAAADSSTLGD